MRTSWLRIQHAMFLCGLLAVMPAAARAERWNILPAEEGTEVVFHSKATMESFDGRTQDVHGWIELNPANLAAGITWQVDVQMASLQTGISLRDKHMRDNHLHTDEYPTARFQGGSLDDLQESRLAEGRSVRLLLVGQLTLHGVTREREIPVSLSLDPSGALEVEAQFDVSLADHDIPLPKFLIVKLADRQEVEVHLKARPPDGNEP